MTISIHTELCNAQNSMNRTERNRTGAWDLDKDTSCLHHYLSTKPPHVQVTVSHFLNYKVDKKKYRFCMALVRVKSDNACKVISTQNRESPPHVNTHNYYAMEAQERKSSAGANSTEGVWEGC
jgi:hypothetical protein